MKLEEEFTSKAGDATPTVRIKPTRDNYEQRAYPSDRLRSSAIL
jgi:hypothetical protein